MDKVSKNFVLQEFVPHSVFNYFLDRSKRFITKDLVNMAQALRDRFGPLTINNWHVGGRFLDSGYRAPNCKIGSKTSAHRRGMAIDIKSNRLSSVEIQEDIKLNWESTFKQMGVTTIEGMDPKYHQTQYQSPHPRVKYTEGWTHVSNEWTPTDKIMLVTLKKWFKEKK